MIIGITGSFGTGKTTVARILRRKGAKVIDADKIAHRFISPTRRKELAKIVFKKRKYLELLCKILHPLIIQQIKKEIKRFNPNKNIIVIDAPLLIETGLHKVVDMLVVVKAKRKTQLQRISGRMGLSRKEILRRIDFQMSLKKKIKLADFVIDNNGPITETKKQVDCLWQEILKNNQRG
ncbi:MAG: dephospho-CoA kinase [Candidatus Omnitrophica bacterium]|nr:dephospho-CoA kinase [Candidatus Omnitrophota bacterium]